MKKYISVFMSLIFVLVLTIPATAAEKLTTQSAQVPASFLLHRKGDIDGDGKVTAGDARLCLRAVVGLEELNDLQLQAADVSENATLVSNKARIILRASVGLEELNTDIIRPDSDTLAVGPFLTPDSGRYTWKCTDAPFVGFASVQQSTSDNAAIGADGDPVTQSFHIRLKTYGTYSFVFELRNLQTNEVLQKYTLTVQRGRIENFPVIVDIF